MYFVVYCIYGCLHPNYVLCVGFDEYWEDLGLKERNGAWNCMILGCALGRTYEEIEDGRCKLWRARKMELWRWRVQVHKRREEVIGTKGARKEKLWRKARMQRWIIDSISQLSSRYEKQRKMMTYWWRGNFGWSSGKSKSEFYLKIYWRLEE